MKYTTKQIARLTWQELKANKLQATNNTLAGLLIVALEFLFVWLTKQTIDIATGAIHVFTLRTAHRHTDGTTAAHRLPQLGKRNAQR